MLVKALYGHLDSKLQDPELPGEPAPGFPSGYYFPTMGLCLTVYVEDFMLDPPSNMLPSESLCPSTSISHPRLVLPVSLVCRHHNEINGGGERYLMCPLEPASMADDTEGHRPPPTSNVRTKCSLKACMCHDSCPTQRHPPRYPIIIRAKPCSQA
jgi:hypothetical protein